MARIRPFAPAFACLLLFILLLLEPSSSCDFTFFPNQVRTQLGKEQMMAINTEPAKSLLFTNTVTNRQQYKYNMIIRLLKAINPRLCRILVTKNMRGDITYPENPVDRKPLSPKYGLPSVRCMINPTTPGASIQQFPMFGRGGAILPKNSMAARSPMCGDLFFFRQGTLLSLEGKLDAGTISVLECQSGREADSQDFKMVPIFQANCTGEPPKPEYAGMDRTIFSVAEAEG